MHLPYPLLALRANRLLWVRQQYPNVYGIMILDQEENSTVMRKSMDLNQPYTLSITPLQVGWFNHAPSHTGIRLAMLFMETSKVRIQCTAF
jgi:hypothetical protein